jgi:hypothetical protein
LIRLSEGNAPYTIHAELTRVGDDFLCIVTGGTRAHIGAVCLAEPAAAPHPVTGAIRTQNGAADRTPVVHTLLGAGHKDGLPAELAAKKLCAYYGVNVVCTAGIHVDGASQEEIGIMMENVMRLLDRLPGSEAGA